MKRFTKMVSVALLALATGVATCFGNAKSFYVPNEEVDNSSKGKIKITTADFDFSNYSREDKIKAEYLIKNDGYKDSDEVIAILELNDDALIDTYLSDDSKYDSVSEYAQTTEGNKQYTSLVKKQNAFTNKLLSKGLITSVEHNYSTILNGVSVKTTYGNFKKLENNKDVKKAILSDSYNLPLTTKGSSSSAVENVVDVYETGIFNSSSVEYTGAGTVVAVLDSGFDCSHSVFAKSPKNPSMTQETIAGVLDQSIAKKNTTSLKVTDVYYSEKIPFVYDYADKDADVNPYDSEHGTHVAGIIGGKDSTITGVATDAQLVLLKVFSDFDEGAKEADILAGLEDAVLLNVDAINMSLGSSCGFTREEDGSEINRVYDKINSTGINLVTAASNSYSSSYGSAQGNTNKVTNPDSATVGSPSTYEVSLSVASISGVKSQYIVANDEYNFFFNQANNLASKQYDFFDMLNIPEEGDVTYDYVTIPGYGLRVNYSGYSKSELKGKIVLVKRGNNTFEEKAKIAASQGAAGIIIYNNVAGEILMNMGKDLSIPTISISKDDGVALATKSKGKLTFNRKNLAGPFMSDFSSWGPTADLKLKPEITAHGGDILSAIPGGGYDKLSGTSMASPNMCGVIVLIRQYVKEHFPSLTSKEVSVMVNQLLMSTATVALNEEGIPYSPRKQGAGLASLKDAVTTKAYITVDGIDRTKLELGDDKNKTGEYVMKFNIVNLSNEQISYDVDITGMTEKVSTSDKDFVAERDQILEGSTKVVVTSGGTSTGNTVNVNAGSICKVEVTYSLTKNDKSIIDSLFPNGMFVEGYVTLNPNSTSLDNIDLSCPFLAFYGDWTQAPLFDKTYYEVESEAHDGSIDDDDKIKADLYATTPYGSYYYNYIIPLGSYLYDIDTSLYDEIPATEEHIAISDTLGTIDGISTIYAGLLRNAKTMHFTIVDKVTGEVMYDNTVVNARKAYSQGGTTIPYFENLKLSSKSLNLKNNSVYEFKMEGLLDYGDGGKDTNLNNTFSFDMTFDNEAPVIKDASYEVVYDKTQKKNRYYVTLNVYDNHYVQSIAPIQFTSSSTYTNLTDHPIPVYGEKNSDTKVKIEITDYIDNLYNDKIITSSLAFMIEDYALNSNLYICELPGTKGGFNFTENGLIDGTHLNSVSITAGESIDLKPYLASEDHQENDSRDFLKYLKWSSSNEKIAVVKEGVVTGLNRGNVTITVSEQMEGQKTSLIVMVKNKPSQAIKKAVDRIDNSKVELKDIKFTEYYVDKAYLSSGDTSKIGKTGVTNIINSSTNISFYPGEKITLHYYMDPWYLPEDRYELIWSTSNPNVATVDDNGTVTAESKGSATISLKVKVDGKVSSIMAAIRVSVKSEFVIENRTLIAYKGKGGDVVIPDDEGILYIGSFAFCLYDVDNTIEITDDDYDKNKIPSFNDTVTSVVVPEGVEEIQKYAFYHCTSLTTVNLPSTCKTVREYAFNSNNQLQNINLDNISVIGERAFEDCSRLNNINLTKIYAIAKRAFEGCASLDSVDLRTLRNAGSEVFKDCTSLTNVLFSKDTKLSYGMFVNTGLTSVTLDVNVIPDFAFANCEKLTSVTINNDLISIGKGAFSGDTKLTNVNILNAVEWIYDQAFYNCPSLTSITLPNSDIKVGNYVFLDCSSLQTVNFAQFTRLIELGGAFLQGTKVSRFTVNENSEYYKTSSDNSLLLSKDGKTLVLASQAFDYDENLVLDYDYIANSAFSGCKKITSVTFTNPKTVIGDYSFYACTALTTITFPENSGITIGQHAFYSTTSLTTVTNLDKVDVIGDYAFAYSNIPSASIKDNAKIKEGAFFRSKITEVTLGKNVDIGFGAFQYASELVTVNMPSAGGVVINGCAFSNAVKLKNIDLSKTSDTIGTEAFHNCLSLTNANISNVKYIEDYAFADCARLLTVDLSSVISIGNSAFARITESGSAPSISTLVLPESLEEIGVGAFLGCSELTSLTIPSKITKISDYAFAFASGLTYLNLGNATEVGEYSFYSVSLLTSVDTSKITKFGQYSFGKCESLTTIDLSNTVEVGDFAFANCKLSTIGETNKLEKVGKYAFQANFFTKIDLSNVYYIGEAAFNSNNGLSDVTLSTKLDELYYGAFLGCNGIENFKFNDNGTIKTDGKINDKYFLSDGVIYSKLPNGQIQFTSYPAGKKDETLTVLDGTIKIEYYSGNMNTNVKKIVLPDSLKVIANCAFYGYSSLEEVEFNSFNAPTLLGSSEGTQLSEDDPGYSLLHPYLDLFGLDLYYLQFVNQVGKIKPIKMTLPSNSDVVGYDALPYEAYFGKVSDAKRNSYVARDNATINYLDSLLLIPSSVEEVKIQDADNISNALTYLNALKQDLTKYGYTQEYLDSMADLVRKEYAKVKELKLARADDTLKQLQSDINSLSETFTISQIDTLKSIMERIKYLKADDKSILDLTKYNACVDSYNQYLSNIDSTVSDGQNVLNASFNYLQIALSSLASVSLLGVCLALLKKKVF